MASAVPLDFISSEAFKGPLELRKQVFAGKINFDGLGCAEKNLLLDLYIHATGCLAQAVDKTNETMHRTQNAELKLKLTADLSHKKLALDRLTQEMHDVLRVNGEQLTLTFCFSDVSSTPSPSPSDNVEENLMDVSQNGNDNSNPKRGRDVDSEDYTLVSRKKKLSEKNNSKNLTKENQNIPNSENSETVIKPKKERIPPFYIEPIKQWPILQSMLKSVAPSMVSILKTKWISIKVDSEPEYRSIQKVLTQQGVHYRSFLLENQKDFKFVLRGLPANASIDPIREALQIEGFSQVSITQLYRGNTRNRVPLPLFLVKLPRQQTKLEALFQINEIVGLRVQFEKYRGRKGPIQCHNCQDYFHSAAVCHMPPRCVKCAGPHKSADCHKQYDEPCKCVHCGSDHPANYGKCPKFPGDRSKKPDNKNLRGKLNPPTKSALPFTAKKVNDAVTYACAVTGVVASPPQPPNGEPKIISAPKIGANSDADFLNQLISFEKLYGKKVVLETFQKCLPELRKAPSEVDRVFILYSSLPSLSG